jgi:hypothetical protein
VTWFDAEAQSHRDIQEEFGEFFAIIPMVQQPNFGAVPDTSRPPQWLPVMFVWEAKAIGLGLDVVKVASRDPQITFLRCDLPYALRRADRVQRYKDGSLFDVTCVDPDGLSGALAELVQVGRQS